MDSWYGLEFMVLTLAYSIDFGSWCRPRLMVGTHDIDLDSWYRHGLMVKTWTHGK